VIRTFRPASRSELLMGRHLNTKEHQCSQITKRSPSSRFCEHRCSQTPTVSSMRTTVIAAAATAALGLAVTGVVTMTSASAAPGCPSVQVVGVPGTGYHLSYDQQGRPTNVDPNKPDVMLSQVAEYLRPDRDRGTIGHEQ